MKLGLVKEDFGLLAAPLGNLYFTGEATSANFSGFVHGAYFAGMETAEIVALRASKAAPVLARIVLIILSVLTAIMQY